MRISLTLIAAVLALCGCKEKPSPAQQAAEDAKAIAQVEAANRSFAPPQPFVPLPISPADLQRGGLLDAGCSFEAEGQSDPILILRAKRAAMKLSRNLITFASDPGSKALPLGTWTHYVGKAGSLRIEAEGVGDPTAQNRIEWAARLTATDAHDRIVYTTAGKLRCGA